MVTDFGDSAKELCAAREATIISPLTHLGLIECAGEDARAFLHNQLTSDVNHLASGSSQYSAWCTAKGRMLASFLVYRNGPDYRALLASDLLSTIRQRMQKFVLRARVRVNDLSADYAVMGVSGPHAETMLRDLGLPVPAKSLSTTEYDKGNIIRLDGTRLLIVANMDSAAELWKKFASIAVAAGTPVWRWLDIQAGILLITDATKEAFVPQMANFDKIGAVSFHKGCYPGQEVVARTQYLGKVKRHLYRLHTARVVTPGTAIYARESAEQPCGMVASAAPAPGGGYDALAVVQESFAETLALRFDTTDGPIEAIEPVAV